MVLVSQGLLAFVFLPENVDKFQNVFCASVVTNHHLFITGAGATSLTQKYQWFILSFLDSLLNYWIRSVFHIAIENSSNLDVCILDLCLTCSCRKT